VLGALFAAQPLKEKPMANLIAVFGEEAVPAVETGECLTTVSNGIIQYLTFDTEAEAQAYSRGAADAFGWGAVAFYWCGEPVTAG
jgi:hypothetical protein